MNKLRLIGAGILNAVAINAIAIPLLVNGSQVVKVVEPIIKVAKTYTTVENKAIHRSNYANCLEKKDRSICRNSNPTGYRAYYSLDEFAGIK